MKNVLVERDVQRFLTGTADQQAIIDSKLELLSETLARSRAQPDGDAS